MKTVQIRLYPSPAQKREIDSQLDLHRQMYNSVLAYSEKQYEDTGKTTHAFGLVKKFVNEARKDERYQRCSSASLQQTVLRFGKAREAMIKRRMEGKYCQLRFKKYHRFNSMEYIYGDGCRIKNDKVYIKNVGFVKAFWHTEVINPQRVIITRRNDTYYANFPVESVKEIIPKDEDAIGLDFGLKHLLTTSDGEIIDSPRVGNLASARLAKAHRAVHREIKGSAARRKRVKILAKVQRRVANQRKDFNHKLSRKLVNKYATICLEDLWLEDIKSEDENACKKHAINRKIYDLGFGQLRNFLAYKAENAGKRVILVNPAFTTQKCSVCGTLVPKDLKERRHICNCGADLDRDVNAAINILRRGLASLTPNGV